MARAISRSGVGVHVDVAVARRRVHHRHGGHLLQRRLQPLAAARDDQVDQAVRSRQLREVLATAVEQLHRPARQPRARDRLGHERRQGAVRASRVARSAQDDRVAALQRQRRAIDGHVRPRLVDHRDHAERRAHLPQVQPALERAVLDLLADGVRQGDDLAHPGRHRGDPLPGQGEPVAQRIRQLNGALVGEIGGVGFEDLGGALVDQLGQPGERRVLALGARARQLMRGALRARACLGDCSRGGCHEQQG